MKLTPLCLALAAIPAWGQIPPVNAPDPGPPVTTMRPNFLYINNNSFPTPRVGSPDELLGTITSDSGGYVPGKWPGYGTNSPNGLFTTSPAFARNGGAFRVFATRSHFAYDDPIVFPGQKGKNHLHVFFGNTNLSGVSTANSILSTGNSTSGGGILNRSGYWVPAVIYVCDSNDKKNGIGTPNNVRCDPARDGDVVDPDELNIYYKGNFGSGESDASAFTGSYLTTHDNEVLPTSFRMISGDANRTTPPTQTDTGFACSVDANHEPLTRYIPGSGISDSASATAWHYCVDTVPDGSNQPKRVVMRVAFPACRNNAGDLDSQPSHNAHVAFPVQDPAQTIGSGALACPTGFNHPMPGVTFHVIYPYLPNDWPFWRLSSDHYPTDQPAGYSVHGDWFNGWRADIMAEWTFNCDVRAQDCHDNILGPNPQVLNDAGYNTPCTVGTGTCQWRFLLNPRSDGR